MEKKKTILIFGISSFLGSSLAEFLKDDYRIVIDLLTFKVDKEETKKIGRVL